MSDENKTSIGSTLAFSALFTAPEVISIVKRRAQLPEEVKTFQSFLKNTKPTDVKDVFTRGIELNNNYEVYKSAYKGAVVKVSLKDKLLNPLRRFFKKDIVTVETVKTQKEDAIKYFNALKTRLAKGENVARESTYLKETESAVKAAKTKNTIQQVLKKGGKETEIIEREAIQNASKNFVKANATTLSKVGNMFKKELTSPFVLFFTAIEAVPEIKEKVIPAFKEKGFKEGIKQTGLSIFKIGANLLSFASGSTFGRVIGMALGAMFAPHAAAAAAIGGTLGSLLGISATNKISEKIVTKVENKVNHKNQEKPLDIEG